MIKIDFVEWGKIRIDGEEYKQVLIVEDSVIERDSEKLHQLFGTTHQIGDWEVEELLKEKPEVIVVGTGWEGILEVSEELRAKSEELEIEIKILRTPEAVEEHNKLMEQGKKVNALIHTTC